ncbi:hypothetical protein PSZ91_24150, partial [Shigella sonnei]|nr:hypothetical protein [Shigella sonnei]
KSPGWRSPQNPQMIRARWEKASLVPREREVKASEGVVFGGFVWPSFASINTKQKQTKIKNPIQEYSEI